MNLGRAWAVIAGVLALASGASAASWERVASDQSGNVYELDMSHFRPNGAYTESWIRQVLKRPLRDVETRKTYTYVIMQRLEDCRSRTFSIIAFANGNAKDQVVSKFEPPRADWKFASPPPGSVGETLQAKICGIAASRAVLKPGLDTNPTTKANWLPTAYDPVSKTKYFIDEAGVIALEGGQVGVIVRADNEAPRKLADGTFFTNGYLAQAFDCKAQTVETMVVDSYDASGNLVGVYAPPADKVEVQKWASGSSVELIAKYACDPNHIAANETEESGTFVGTGWLGPKGYIITANHVIEGATKLELAQNGKLVGTAELVVADPANDIAVLRPVLPAGARVAIPFLAGSARLGEQVFTLGYPSPDTLGLALKMTSGEVSALAGNDVASGRMDDARLLQVSMPIHSGNSGGPVIDVQGRAVGIVISKMEKAGENEAAQNVNYALKITYVRSLLGDLPSVGSAPSAVPKADIAGLVDELKGSVFLVIATR